MQSVVFEPTDQVLAIRCLDGRSEAPVQGVTATSYHQVRLAGGILAPLVGARNHPEALPVLNEFLFDQIMVGIELKHPVAIVIVTHSDCGAAKALGLSEGQVADRLQQFVRELVDRGVTLPIYGAHDNHCTAGVKRVFEKVLTANLPPKSRFVAEAA
jgi:carbonic anhydrase